MSDSVVGDAGRAAASVDDGRPAAGTPTSRQRPVHPLLVAELGVGSSPLLLERRVTALLLLLLVIVPVGERGLSQ